MNTISDYLTKTTANNLALSDVVYALKNPSIKLNTVIDGITFKIWKAILLEIEQVNRQRCT